MRIIHFADLHIGVELYGRPLPGRAWSSRMQDFLDAFDSLVDFAIGEGVDAVIFAGDAYKAREPSQTHQREFARRVRRLSDAAIPTFLLVGNHDLPNAESRAHALEIFRTLAVPHVYVGDNQWFIEHGYRPVVLPTRSGPLQVAFVPWPQVSQLLAEDERTAGMSIDQINKVVEEKLSALVEAQTQHIDPELPAVLVAHVSINDFLVRDNPGSEQWMTVGTAPTVLKSSLHQEHFDYIALGHHHNAMDLHMTTPCWYSGSMQPVDFGEGGRAKGFMVVDIDPAKPRGGRVVTEPQLHEVQARRFLTIEVQPRDIDPTAEVCAAIAAAETDDAIVRVQVKLTPEQAAQFRVSDARRALEGAHYVASIRSIVPDEQRRLLPAHVQPDAASPIESLETYLKLKEVAEERRGRLIASARELVTEVEQAHA